MEQDKRTHVTCDGVAGGAGALLHGHLHRGDGHQDRGHGLCPPPGLLSQERLEYHGFHRGGLWLSAHVDAEVRGGNPRQTERSGPVNPENFQGAKTPQVGLGSAE